MYRRARSSSDRTRPCTVSRSTWGSKSVAPTSGCALLPPCVGLLRARLCGAERHRRAGRTHAGVLNRCGEARARGCWRLVVQHALAFCAHLRFGAARIIEVGARALRTLVGDGHARLTGSQLCFALVEDALGFGCARLHADELANAHVELIAHRARIGQRSQRADLTGGFLQRESALRARRILGGDDIDSDFETLQFLVV